MRAPHTVGFVIRYERDSVVYFRTARAETTDYTSARVFLLESVANRHAYNGPQHGQFQSRAMVRLDDAGLPRWIHPSHLKTSAQIEEERAARAAKIESSDQLDTQDSDR